MVKLWTFTLTIHDSGIAETVCVLVFASALGRWVDSNPSRLRVLLLTIFINRISVFVSCIIWFTILSFSNPAPKQAFFAMALILGMVEKLSRGTNILSIERDWVPTLANTSVDAEHPVPYDLTHINTAMRRIDMLCKLIAPLAVSTFVSTVHSERLAVVIVASINMMSLGPECWGIQQVWDQNSRLRIPKECVDDTATSGDPDQPMQLGYTKTSSARIALDLPRKIALQVIGSIRSYMADLGYYFGTDVWIPSLCAAVPHASVLTFSGTMLTYLLNAGYSLNIITGAKACGAVFEIGSTFIFPLAVGILSTRKYTASWYHKSSYHELEQTEAPSRSDTSLDDVADTDAQSKQSSTTTEHGVIRVGYWALGGLILSLVSIITIPLVSSGLLKHSVPTELLPGSRRPQPILSRYRPLQ